MDKGKKNKKEDPNLKDVKPGSDADELPVAEAGETPPDPNKKQN